MSNNKHHVNFPPNATILKDDEEPNQDETESDEKNTYRDYSRSVSDLTSALPRATSKRATFPVLLHRILSNPDYSDIISWLPHGRSWRVLKPKRFEANIIPRYFDHTKYPSFCRQVNGWGFIRVTSGPDQNSYYHEFFLRGMPQLAEMMTRPAGFKKPSTDANARPPNFEQMSKESPLPESNPNRQTSSFSENTETQVLEEFDATNETSSSLGGNQNILQSQTDSATYFSSASSTNEYQRLLQNLGSEVNYPIVRNSFESPALESFINIQGNTSFANFLSPPQQLMFGEDRLNYVNNISNAIGQNSLFSQNQYRLTSGMTGNSVRSRTDTTLPNLLNNAPTVLTDNENLPEASLTSVGMNRFQREIWNIVSSAGAGNRTSSSSSYPSSLNSNILTELSYTNNPTEVLHMNLNQTGLQIQDPRMREIFQMVGAGVGSTRRVSTITGLDTSSNLLYSMLPQLPPLNAHSTETASGIEIDNLQVQDPRIREILLALQANRLS